MASDLEILLIRPAVLSEIPALWQLVQAYAEEINPAGQKPQERATKRTLMALIAHPTGVVLVRDQNGSVQGMLAGSIGTSPWAETRIADYLIFYLCPACRGGRAALSMLRAYEQWAASKGAEVVGVSDTGSQLGRLLKRQGYQPAEQKYLRCL